MWRREVTAFSGAARVAGVVGAPVRQSLSPLIHNAWIAAAGLDAVYVPFSPEADKFDAFISGLRRGSMAGLNVTLPFKQAALALADRADEPARAAGAANLLLFDDAGAVEARNTDGIGLLYALDLQAPGWAAGSGVVVVLGAGGAARGAVAALVVAGFTVRIVNRTRERAVMLAQTFDGADAMEGERLADVFAEAFLVINATSAGLEGRGDLDPPLQALPPQAVVMDMVYRPLCTPLLRQAQARGLQTVDGLAMLVGQAIPSFQALFGRPVPPQVDVRALALAALEEGGQ
ncbi:shikimate dehydrogenase [Caulobacter sp. S45]|uniref:shikimate dehydrogenase n=1 Tax=Caulobacter sp. S45 TaxID=1641861 RepID=UPI001575613F|nr:shikimate dehydrogenase [Caulobacter sp. S45]